MRRRELQVWTSKKKSAAPLQLLSTFRIDCVFRCCFARVCLCGLYTVERAHNTIVRQNTKLFGVWPTITISHSSTHVKTMGTKLAVQNTQKRSSEPSKIANANELTWTAILIDCELRFVFDCSTNGVRVLSRCALE